MEDPYVSHSGVKKRASNACNRCRRQKIRCTGKIPCTHCSKRNLMCTFDDSTKKVLVTQGYLQQLRRNIYDRPPYQAPGQGSPDPTEDTSQAAASLDSLVNRGHYLGPNEHYPAVSTSTRNITRVSRDADHLEPANGTSLTGENSRSTSPGAHLVNPLAIDLDNYMVNENGTHIHLGTSSDWSFGRRVLSRACERMGVRIPTDQLYFEGSIYSIDWESISSQSSVSHRNLLPSSDYAIYLINAVKFHCGQMFHLLEEEDFMQHFSKFHTDGIENIPSLWYTHYLIIISLGKAFVARNTQQNGPSGVALFLEAFKRWPELVIGRTNIAECVEILICIAIYLQCIDFRNAAYNMIGQAVRRCFELGFHTQMGHHNSQSPIVQRARRIWWTVYMLDRQMAALMGVPQSIRDEDISAPLPELGNSQKGVAMEVHVRLSRVIAEILNTVYSTEGRLPRKFLQSTRKALQSIAAVTELLKQHTDLPKGPLTGGISRLGAYLHLLNHQCICLVTRPVAFSFLDRRLQSKPGGMEKVAGGALTLMRLCVDSAQNMLYILSGLRDQDMLERFLPFDLGAVFIAAIIVIMAKFIDSRLLEDSSTWLDMAYSILDDISSRGNKIAVMHKRELCHLADVLSTSRVHADMDHRQSIGERVNLDHPIPAIIDTSNMDTDTDTDRELFEQPFWHEQMTAEQLILLADSLDLKGFDWITTSMDPPSS